MKLYIYQGKTNDILKEALEELEVTEDDVLYKEEYIKGKLFKSETYKYSIIKITDVLEYAKTYLENLFIDMNLNVKLESNIRDKQINININSKNNALLIGKNGKNLSALTVVLKQAIYNEINIYPYINIDIAGYKDKQLSHLKRLAKNIAKEVINTKTPVTMESMNSYERRIVHTELAKIEEIKTISEGEEPNRHIIVKLK